MKWVISPGSVSFLALSFTRSPALNVVPPFPKVISSHISVSLLVDFIPLLNRYSRSRSYSRPGVEADTEREAHQLQRDARETSETKSATISDLFTINTNTGRVLVVAGCTTDPLAPTMFLRLAQSICGPRAMNYAFSGLKPNIFHRTLSPLVKIWSTVGVARDFAESCQELETSPLCPW